MATAARQLKHRPASPEPRALRVVRRALSEFPPQQATHPRRRRGVIAITCLSLVAVVFAVLVEQVVLAQSAFELGKIRKQLTEAQSLQEELLLEAATLESPARVENFARNHLGMVDPDPALTQYIVADIGRRNEEAPAGSDTPAAGAAAAAATSEVAP
ncbi:MAG TPA: cell division protein FtsL [Actinomycetota bacterium]|nr:cell division protein FtsL [Actinomycetota bacterium]